MIKINHRNHPAPGKVSDDVHELFKLREFLTRNLLMSEKQTEAMGNCAMHLERYITLLRKSYTQSLLDDNLARHARRGNS